GQRLPVSDEVVAYVQSLADPIIPPGRARGAFAAEVNPGVDATPLQRLVAFSGRGPVHS
ncbi:MAG: TIGR03086 family protein, partial [Propionibacteriales bacterium]|nr:TIGR03086 family protein [Propionibacteriales bacterium]